MIKTARDDDVARVTDHVQPTVVPLPPGRAKIAVAIEKHVELCRYLARFSTAQLPAKSLADARKDLKHPHGPGLVVRADQNLMIERGAVLVRTYADYREENGGNLREFASQAH